MKALFGLPMWCCRWLKEHQVLALLVGWFLISIVWNFYLTFVVHHA